MEVALLKYQESGKNALGQKVYDFVESEKLEGFLDMLTGNEADRATALTSSTHIFLTEQVGVQITTKDRIRAKGIDYEVSFVDNPVNLDHHLEIYLKVVA
ncbi:TPA: phage head closure protein [Streptococcus suis]|nr:phage head closure protein [Streptococcus suis]HEM3611868.1 phage head closure protein [Streptococcus suis]HEM3626053.1 phage head closure protein [Streptococcus suis]HEM3630384.1 phage head closure protein [Streptococcus suis]HEM3643859.1 phage head closure protein [Streptococcus suis]